MATNASTITLDSLLLPGTPDVIQDRYRSLSARAAQTSFGLLEEDLVMLDTETTGLSYRHNELIEIAAARITGRQVVERFQTFVHPTGVIPAEIQVLTGITNLDVSNAPHAEEAVAQLAKFVGGLPVVAHNATFDRTFIESVPGGSDVSDIWIDSLALSRMALPRLRSHRLADMAQAFGCDPVTHRAMADVDALCGMWRILLLALSDLPTNVIRQMATMHADVAWQYRPLVAHLAGEQFGNERTLKEVRRSLVAQTLGHRRNDAMEEMSLATATSMFNAIDSDAVARAFEHGGVVAQMYDTYEMRPEQVIMAQEVREALNTSQYRAIEAGTGVGKSMAYLLPAIAFAQANDVTVGVATKTNALTDQLMTHELPALDATLPSGVSYTSIKGYDHYPCLRRVDLATVRELPVDEVEADGRSQQGIASDMLTAIATVLAYASQSPEGDVDGLGIRWRYVPRDLLTTTPTECVRTRCPYYPNECFVHGARRRAACADVVVTNHSLLLRDIALENAILPPVRHWIVDEAHSFEQEARRQWALELSAEAANKAFATLGGTNTGVLHAVLTQTGTLDGATLVAGLITKAATHVQRASVTNADLLTCVHELMSLAGGTGGYDSTTLWIDDNVRKSDQWHAIENSGAVAATAYEQAIKSLQEAMDAIAPESSQLASQLSDATRALRDLLQALRLIVLEPDESYVYSAELYRAKKRMGRERMTAEKLDVGADLAQKWYPDAMSVTYASATIAVGNSFEHFEHAVGLDQVGTGRCKSLRVDSSFDYDKNMSVIVARDMPDPNDKSYLAALEDLLFDVHTSMEGSVLTLFTNRREMEKVYAALQPRLASEGLDLACQERRSSPRRLRERFMAEEQLSLFALKSFWEGFDAAGDTLRCVVIPKLPFASPRDPLVRERDLREQRAWWRYSLPEAVLSVKQAAGRLIRTNTDSGILVLADARVSTKRYGQTFLRALPTSNVSKLERASVGRYINLWRASHER
ncbi:MAG: DNA polymerase III subunit epsilon [Atopobiaceae bacterium]|nr:DNA polymerase III subunit epsilon [Atopobiaceae bacterium]